MTEYKTSEQAFFWLSQIEQQGLNPEQKLEFQTWLDSKPEHTIAFAEAELMWKALADEKIKKELALIEPLPSTFSFIDKYKQQVKLWVTNNKLIWLGTLAASAFVMTLMQFPLLKPVSAPPLLAEIIATERYHTILGESRELILSDGSKVLLDAESSIEVRFSKSQRNISLLTGSAFFKVTHDPTRTFIVASGAVAAKVTGTEFEVQRKQNAVYVSVAQGSVAVSQPFPDWNEKEAVKNNKTWSRSTNATVSNISLIAGQGVRANRLTGLGAVDNIPTQALAAWRQGKLVYINSVLGDVVEDMNRYSDKQIVISAKAKELKLSGTFDSKNIPAMLNVIKAALPLEINKKDDEFYISMTQHK